MPADAAAAVQVAESERFQTNRVVTVSAGHAVHDTYTAFLPPLLPSFIDGLSLSRTQAGVLTVFMQVPSMLQPFIGYLADRASLRYGIGPVIAGRLSGNRLGRGMGFWMVGGELGRTLGPLVIAAYYRYWPDDLSHTPWLMIGGWLASALLFIWLRDVDPRLSNLGQGLPWRQALRIMAPLLWPLTGILFVRAFMSAALTTFLPTFMAEEGAELWLAGISLAVLEAAGVAGALLGGSLSDRLGRRLILLVSLVATPALMVLFAFVDGWLRFPVLLALGLVALSVTPVIMALVQESFPEHRALANGIYMSISFLIRSGVVVIVGAMGDLWGMRTSFLVCALVTLGGLPFLLFLPKRER
jgi:FSR family fosmidomycin resistance protein-like MFS transporter